MCNMLNVKYPDVDKQQIKHVSLSAQVTFLLFLISFLFLMWNCSGLFLVGRVICTPFS